jgi:hypothetical protein
MRAASAISLWPCRIEFGSTVDMPSRPVFLPSTKTTSGRHGEQGIRLELDLSSSCPYLGWIGIWYFFFSAHLGAFVRGLPVLGQFVGSARWLGSFKWQSSCPIDMRRCVKVCLQNLICWNSIVVDMETWSHFLYWFNLDWYSANCSGRVVFHAPIFV